MSRQTHLTQHRYEPTALADAVHCHSTQAVPPAAKQRQRGVFERPYQRSTRPSIVGWALMFFYLAALVFYIYVRAAKTLNLGAKYQW